MGLGFEDLEVYQEARKFRNRIYALTKMLPSQERYGLFPQMRRAAVSVTNCIAEGQGSKSFRHNVSYLYRSRGSMCELQDDISTCEDQQYFQKEHLDDLRRHSETVIRLINGYIRHLESRLRAEASKKNQQRGRPTS